MTIQIDISSKVSGSIPWLKWVVFALFLFVGAGNANAQALSSHEALKLGLSNQGSVLDMEIARAKDNLSAAKWKFVPHLYYQPSWTYKYNLSGGENDDFFSHDLVLSDLFAGYQAITDLQVAKIEMKAQEFASRAQTSAFASKLLTLYFDAVAAKKKMELREKQFESIQKLRNETREAEAFTGSSGPDGAIRAKLIRARVEKMTSRQNYQSKLTELSILMGLESGRWPVLADDLEYEYYGISPNSWNFNLTQRKDDPEMMKFQLREKAFDKARIGSYLYYVPYPSLRVGQTHDITTGDQFIFSQVGLVIPIFKGLESRRTRREIARQKEALESQRNKHLRMWGASVEQIPPQLSELKKAVAETEEYLEPLREEMSRIKELFEMSQIPPEQYNSTVERWVGGEILEIDLRSNMIHLQILWDKNTGAYDLLQSGERNEKE